MKTVIKNLENITSTNLKTSMTNIFELASEEKYTTLGACNGLMLAIIKIPTYDIKKEINFDRLFKFSNKSTIYATQRKVARAQENSLYPTPSFRKVICTSASYSDTSTQKLHNPSLLKKALALKNSFLNENSSTFQFNFISQSPRSGDLYICKDLLIQITPVIPSIQSTDFTKAEDCLKAYFPSL